MEVFQTIIQGEKSYDFVIPQIIAISRKPYLSLPSNNWHIDIKLSGSRKYEIIQCSNEKIGKNVIKKIKESLKEYYDGKRFNETI
jgi:hypothetical protein